MPRTASVLVLALLAAVFLAVIPASGAVSPARADDDSVAALVELSAHIDSALQLTNSGDINAAYDEYTAFDNGWQDIEGGIRETSRDNYLDIEDAMAGVQMAFGHALPDPTEVSQALSQLDAQIDTFEQAVANGTVVSSGDEDVTFQTLMQDLDIALERISDGNANEALEEVDKFRHDWVVVEGLVGAKSSSDYEHLENSMALAKTQLSKNPPDMMAAQATITEMQDRLEPYASNDVTYGVFDSAVILLREGFEALLILGALLAFLKKMGQEDKSKWVWAGTGAGVLASIVVAVVVTSIFAGAAAAGVNRELMEGVTGLFAAVMLIYMSYWLHTNASLGGWRRYIQQKMQSALATNRLIYLSLIAFLAVFREGAETVLFYIGIAPATKTSDLLLGILIGLGGLAVLGVVVITFGKRFPIRPFFSLASILVLYLAFKFVGNGVHALQVAGTVPATASDSLPTVSFFGIYPTWETVGAQLALAAVVVSVLLWRRVRVTLSRAAQKQDAVTTS